MRHHSALAVAPYKAPPAGLAVLLCERPFPQHLPGVHVGRPADMSIDGRDGRLIRRHRANRARPRSRCWPHAASAGRNPEPPAPTSASTTARQIPAHLPGAAILDATGLAAVSKAAAYISAGTVVPDAQMPRSTAEIIPGPQMREARTHGACHHSPAAAARSAGASTGRRGQLPRPACLLRRLPGASGRAMRAMRSHAGARPAHTLISSRDLGVEEPI